MDMCVVKVMPGKEKSQKRVAEHSVNNLQEVLTILPVSITNTSPAASQRPSVETSSSNSAFEKGVLKDDAVKSTNSKGQCRLSASLKSELTKVIDKLQRANLNSAVENSHHSDQCGSLFQY